MSRPFPEPTVEEKAKSPRRKALNIKEILLNRVRNVEKDEGKPLELWALILGRPTGNLMAAVEDKRLDDVEKYVFQVSAVLAEIYGKVRELKNSANK